jgi:hypothetical protein
MTLLICQQGSGPTCGGSYPTGLGSAPWRATVIPASAPRGPAPTSSTTVAITSPRRHLVPQRWPVAAQSVTDVSPRRSLRRSTAGHCGRLTSGSQQASSRCPHPSPILRSFARGQRNAGRFGRRTSHSSPKGPPSPCERRVRSERLGADFREGVGSTDRVIERRVDGTAERRQAMFGRLLANGADRRSASVRRYPSSAPPVAVAACALYLTVLSLYGERPCLAHAAINSCRGLGDSTEPQPKVMSPASGMGPLERCERQWHGTT